MTKISTKAEKAKKFERRRKTILYSSKVKLKLDRGIKNAQKTEKARFKISPRNPKNIVHFCVVFCDNFIIFMVCFTFLYGVILSPVKKGKYMSKWNNLHTRNFIKNST